MIIVTGGAGFIGSNLILGLNKIGKKKIIVVDDINHTLKKENIKNLQFDKIIGIHEYFDWAIEQENLEIEAIFHLGACSNTLEKDLNYLYENNVVYSQKLWKQAIEKKSLFIYASSAATYGDGSLGFSDDHDLIPKLKPLNPYGQSKQDFDIWVLKQKQTPSKWIGLKYFNVYGPGEAHKGRMASVVWHFMQQLKKGETLKLFGASHGYAAGEQKRDFIYVEDAVNMTLYAYQNKMSSGIYNVGTGTPRSFNDLAKAMLSIHKNKKVEYIPFPKELEKAYQAFTCAPMDKFFKTEFDEPIKSIEQGIKKYYNEN
jgi:ADP-L-glycero-D-manno-heptose 6-epimerase